MALGARPVVAPDSQIGNSGEGLMLFAAIDESAELLLTIAAAFLATALIARGSPRWVQVFNRRRIVILWIIVLLVFLGKVSEDVLAHESGPVDELLLLWIHDVVPESLTPFFRLLTLSASASVIFPAVAVVTLLLVRMRQRLRAFAFTSTVLSAVALVYMVKTVVGRARPVLWETQWYWGSSFPSGHTLTSAAFATAACLCLIDLRPRAKWPAICMATAWVVLVALSRLVLGVHWPSDVAAAAFAGVLLALAVDATTVWVESVVRFQRGRASKSPA